MQTCRDIRMFTTHFVLYAFKIYFCGKVCIFQNQLENFDLYFTMWRAGICEIVGWVLPL